MSNFNKWNRDENLDSDKLNVVLFVSRNKDNKHLKDFTERRNAFTTTREFEDIKDQFKAFVEAGQPGEFSRMYTSVNPRSNSKTFKALQHKMLDDEFNLSSLPQRVAGLAAKKENAYDSKHLNWLFDFWNAEETDLKNKMFESIKESIKLSIECLLNKNFDFSDVIADRIPISFLTDLEIVEGLRAWDELPRILFSKTQTRIKRKYQLVRLTLLLKDVMIENLENIT